jgi:hypothetical protein
VAVQHVNDPIGLLCQPVVVSDHHQRSSVPIQPAEKIEDLVPGGRVQLSGGLIGQE